MARRTLSVAAALAAALTTSSLVMHPTEAAASPPGSKDVTAVRFVGSTRWVASRRGIAISP